jgi:hypothetical protein
MVSERLPQPGEPGYDPRAERALSGLGEDVVSLDDVRSEARGKALTNDERFILNEGADAYRVIVNLVSDHPEMITSKGDLKLHADLIARDAKTDIETVRGVIGKLPDNFVEEISREEKAA